MGSKPPNHVDFLKRLGTRIRQRRLELRITQEELAGDQCSKSFISQVEQGKVWPSLPLMIHIAQRLGRPIDWFLTDDPPLTTPLEQMAAELGVEPIRLRQALERVLFGS